MPIGISGGVTHGPSGCTSACSHAQRHIAPYSTKTHRRVVAGAQGRPLPAHLQFHCIVALYSIPRACPWGLQACGGRGARRATSPGLSSIAWRLASGL